ncbi:MAG: methionyl-tRNA formyltransferase [Actinobacteria bacterium]|nr:methionyl-tRNA formyltransferase [Actinomycetota bacterium]
MKFIFAGTPDFAARVLTHLDDIGRRPCLVISQPDRPRGRGRVVGQSEVIAAAARLQIPNVQVRDINSQDSLAEIASTGARVLVVAAFGQIVKPPLLDDLTCLNVHASLLPAYRGAAPIERALASGEAVSGVSIMRMTRGLDEGPWALQTSLSLGLRDDAGSVARGLAVLGANGVDQVLTGLGDGTVTWTEQAGKAGYAAKLSPDDAVLDPARTAARLHDQVRSLSPAVGAKTACGGLEFKVWRTWPYGMSGLAETPGEARHIEGKPGRLAVAESRLFIGCAEGAVEALLLQPAGKGRMPAADFLRGYQRRLSDRLDLAVTARDAPAAESRSPLPKE